ncbi:DUF4097 family beta strand repeat-containing protein [Pedobacter insulae]|uniref:Adhesin domain-containing protein n=1 Tax=Pedobacter insulae TaxID=414048 RepID=A0A1I2UR48_9SPHI|nr:hypothetical protein [Pedobacter insulae]SFG79498.1 hypothetical protein SAMN04489864_102295 [Pedobacter insulae]
MKKQFIILLVLLSANFIVKAQQEYRLAKSSGNLKINMSSVNVEGYDGKEIIFSGQKIVIDEPTDERAKGLVPISSSRYIDNTGIGINVSENGQNVTVNLVSKKPVGVVTIKVPQNMKVSIMNNFNTGNFVFSYNSSVNMSNTTNDNKTVEKVSDEIVLKNLKNEIEVSVYNSKIKLENNTGPMNIKTVSGSVDAIFNGDIKGPVSIVSATNYVDVTMPATTKANIEMGSSYGKLFAGKEFKFDLDKTETESFSNVATIGSRVAGRQIYTAAKVDTATSSATKAKTSSSGGKNKTEVIVVKGFPTARLSGTTKGTGVQILNGAVFTDGNNLFTRSYALGGDRIKGKLNGGGVDLIFKSTNKNVYLREK